CFYIMLLTTLNFLHIIYQYKSQRMKNRMRLYGFTQLQQIIAKAVVTFFITGILSVGSFMLLQKILTFELIGEDYMRIFTVGVLLHIIFRSEEHTSELQSRFDLVCRLLLEKK